MDPPVTGLADDVAAFVRAEIQKQLGELETAVGTVVTSPSQVSTDPLTVVLDGSALAVPVKQFRGFPVFPGYRVGLVRMGTDWVVVGAFTNPGAGTGTMRMTLGADVPPELASYGIDVAMLFYVTDFASGLEVGYFFAALSNTLDVGNQRVNLYGSVKYPVPGDPGSATTANVKTHWQMNLAGFTTFKDYPVNLSASVPSLRVDSAQTVFTGAEVNLGIGTNLVAQSDTNFGFTYSQPRGIVNYLTSSASSLGLAANASQVSVSLTHRFLDGRAYRVELLGTVAGPVNSRVGFTLRLGSLTTGTLVADYGWFDTAPDAAAAAMNANASVYLRRVHGAGNVDQLFNLTMTAGNLVAGNHTHVANATIPRGLVVFDVGDADDFVWAPSI